MARIIGWVWVVLTKAPDRGVLGCDMRYREEIWVLRKRDDYRKPEDDMR